MSGINQTVTLTQPASLISATSTQTNVSCFGGSNGRSTITATGGTGTLTYSWVPSGGTASTATGLTATGYTCTVKDVNGCSITNTVLITQPTVLTSTLSSQTNVSCNGGSNGAATVSVTGGTSGYTYSWAPSGGTSSIATGLTAGTYTCTITDGNACTTTKTVSLTQPTALTATTTQTNISCAGGSNGIASVSATGGTSGYTYSWAPSGGTAASATNLTAGTYTCTITDANTCSLTKTVTLTQPAGLIVLANANRTVVCSGNSVTLTGSGANSYSWSGGVINGTSFVPTTSTVYTVTGTNTVTGCSTTATVGITVNTLPTISVNSGAICTGSSFTMVPTGATTYTYSNGSNVVSPTANTSYTVTGTNSNGCVSSVGAVSTVTVNALPTISVNSGAICTGSSFTMVPTGALTYTYSNGSDVVSPTATADYTVTGTNSNGCVSSIGAVSTVTVNALPTISVNSGAICTGASFTMTPTGALTYTYSNGSDVVTPTATADYTVTGTDANGCNNTAVSTVTVNALPTISVNSGAICTGASFTMTPTGALTYTYSNGSDVVSPTATTDYTVTGTDANGCVSSIGAVSTVTVNALPTVSVNSGAICTGASFTMVATGATTYTYSNGSDVVTPTATADYTVTGTDVNGCENTAVSTVSVNTLPTITAVSSSTLLCVGETSTLTATGALTYAWDNGNTGSVIAVSPTVTTDYTVTGTDANGCSNTAVVSQSVSPCTGIQTVTSKDVMVVVSPNPNKGVFNVKVTEGTLTNVSVIDITGRTIVSTVVNSDNTLLDITQYAEGVYYVVVKTTIGTSIKKVIKN